MKESKGEEEEEEEEAIGKVHSPLASPAESGPVFARNNRLPPSIREGVVCVPEEWP